MIDMSSLGQEIINIARKHNCLTQVTLVEEEEKEIHVRKGEIERLLTSISMSTGIRLFSGKRSIILSFAGPGFDNIEEKITKALQDLTYLEEDPARRLLTAEECGDQTQQLELEDRRFDQVDIKEAVETLKKIETAGLSLSPRLSPSEMAEYSASRTRVHLFSSLGLQKSYRRTSYSFAYTAVAEDKGVKETDSYYEHKRFFSDFPELPIIGQKAAERALKKLGGKKIKSGKMPVLFSPRTASSILDLLGSALDGEQVLLGNSFLVGKLGQKLFQDNITILDHPHIPRLIGSYPFDGEGMNSRQKAVIEKGRLVTYLHNSYSASRLNLPLTGNASISTSYPPGIKNGNFYLQPGQGRLDDLVGEMKRGLLVDDLFLSGLNETTGDFSFGCSGFWVEKGRQTQPVKEITIAGNLLQLIGNISAIADDNEWKSSVCSPSILVSHLAVAGI